MNLSKSVNKEWFVYFHIQNDRLSNICPSETLQQVNAVYVLDGSEWCFRAIAMCSCASGLLKVHYDVTSIEVNTTDQAHPSHQCLRN